ncbi:MAG TPA: histidinol-phosphate transaminase [Chryseosolibacter sp.]|nr:histidinol-phosphate transaminase [Chryseosolibacter sp.]
MTKLSRRKWMQATVGLASGAVISPALVHQLMAAPASEAERNFFLRRQEPVISVRLNSNENPYGPSAAARKAVNEILSEGNRYPFQVVTEMKQTLAAKEGLSPDHIAIGAGSGEMLCASGVAFGIEGGAVLSPYPTFPLMMSYAEVFRARWDKVDLNDKLEVDYTALAARVKDDTRLVFICNPNNPTGTLVDPAIVRAFCEEVSKKVTVFSDEAYLEFLEPSSQVSMVDMVKNDKNIVVSRTFSKIYGLAGLRIGYLVGRPDLIRKISRYQTGFTVSQAAIAAAKASLGDEAFMTMARKKNAEARKILTDYLDKKGFFYGKSHTNFVFIDTRGQAERLMKVLAERGIGIRVWDYAGKQWNRISVGTADEMKLLVKNLEEIV